MDDSVVMTDDQVYMMQLIVQHLYHHTHQIIEIPLVHTIMEHEKRIYLCSYYKIIQVLSQELRHRTHSDEVVFMDYLAIKRLSIRVMWDDEVQRFPFLSIFDLFFPEMVFDQGRLSYLVFQHSLILLWNG